MNLPPFQLKDQHGKDHNNTEFDKKVMLLIGGDKDGSKYATDVGFEVYNSLSEQEKDQTNFVPIADLRIVPRLLRKLVLAFMPKNVDMVLMDWNGDLCNQWPDDFKANHGGIVVLDQARNVLFHTSVNEGPKEDPQLITQLLSIVRDALSK